MISSRFGSLGLFVLLAPGALWAQDWAKVKPPFLAPLPLPQGNEALDQFTRILQRTPYDDLTRTESELRGLKAEEAKKTSAQKDMVLIQLALEMQGTALEKALVFVEKNPTDLEMALLAGRICRQQSKLEQGVKVLEDAINQPTLKDNPALKLQILIELARNLELAGKLAPARARFKEAAELLDLPGALAKSSYTSQGITLQSADVHERLAVLAQKAKEPDTAMTEFLLATKIDPARRARLGLPLAELLEAKAQHDAALTRINDYLALFPKATEAVEFKARILEKAGHPAEALALWEELHKRDPLHGINAILLAQKLIQAKRTQEGEAILLAEWKELESRPAADALIKLWGSDKENGPGKLLDAITYAVNVPDNEKFYSTESLSKKTTKDSNNTSEKDSQNEKPKKYEKNILKVMLRAGLSDLNLLEDMMKTALARRGTNAEPTPVMMCWLQEACDAWYFGIYDTMEELAEVVLAQKSISPNDKASTKTSLLNSMNSQGKFAQVIAKGPTLLKDVPTEKQAEIRYQIAKAYALSGKLDQALKELTKLMDNVPESHRFAWNCHKTRLYSYAGDYEKSLAESTKLIQSAKFQDQIALIQPVKCMALLGLDKKVEAIAAFRETALKFPNDRDSLVKAGYHLITLLDDPSEGENLILRGLDLKSFDNGGASCESTDYFFTMAQIHFRHGRKDEAARLLRQAIRTPGAKFTPQIWNNLGDVESALGNGEEARKHWKKALELTEKGVGIDAMWYIPSQFKVQLKQKLAQAAGDSGQ